MDFTSLIDCSQAREDERDRVGFAITQWFRSHERDENLIYDKAGSRQACFVRDTLARGLDRVDIIGFHTSKSVKLPVYLLEYKGLQIVMRDNFYDWKVSVISPIDLDIPDDLFGKQTQDIAYYYCEGFKEEWVFGQYQNNPKEFTIEVYSDYTLFTLLYLIKKQVDAAAIL